MAHKKGQGSCKNGRDSQGQRRGVKCCHGQQVTAGSIVIRQCGTKYLPGLNAKMGRDYTIFAKSNGIVQFHKQKIVNIVSPN